MVRRGFRAPAPPGRGGIGGERGQAAVELALVLPVLLLVTVAACQVAMGLNCYLVVGSASREGARRAAETNDAAQARDASLVAAKGLPGGAPSVEVAFPKGRGKGSPVVVKVAYRMPLLLPGLGSLVPRPTFSRSTTMSLEKGPR